MKMGYLTETKIIHLLLECGKLKQNSILKKLGVGLSESKDVVTTRTIRNRLKYMCDEGLITKDDEGYYSIGADYFISGKTLRKDEWKEILNNLLENQVLDVYRFLRNHLGNEKKYLLDNLELERYQERVMESVHMLSDNRDVIRKINYALAKDLYIRVKYKGKEYTLCPVRYVVSRDGSRKYLYGIRKRHLISMELGQLEFLEYLDREGLDKAEYVRQIQRAWDIDAQDPCKIRILVRKNKKLSKKAIDEIRNYLGSPVENTEEYAVFEGEIAGINDFQTWLRSYLEVCFILEPEKMRQEFIHALLEKNKRYGGKL